MTLDRLLAIDSPPGENPRNRSTPTPTTLSESSVRNQDSDISIPSRFFASDNGSSHPSVNISGHDSIENLSWFDRTRLELTRQSVDQGAQSLDVSKQSLKLSKVALGVSLTFGAAGVIMAGINTNKNSDDQSTDNSSSG